MQHRETGIVLDTNDSDQWAAVGSLESKSRSPDRTPQVAGKNCLFQPRLPKAGFEGMIYEDLISGRALGSGTRNKTCWRIY